MNSEINKHANHIAIQGEINRLRDKLVVSERTAKADAQLKVRHVLLTSKKKNGSIYDI